jgi:mRNA interferase MazF
MINQRDIILIPFPFSDLSESKVRPALVVSNNTYNSQSLDIVVTAITSNLSPNPYKVFIDRKDLEGGFLPVKSAVRVDKPFSFLQGKVLKTLGTITTQKFDEVMVSLQNILK